MEIYLDSKIHSEVACFHSVLMCLTWKFYAFSFFFLLKAPVGCLLIKKRKHLLMKKQF